MAANNICKFELCLPKQTIICLFNLLEKYPDTEVLGHLHFKPSKHKITELELDKNVHVGNGTSVNIDLPVDVKKLIIDCHTHPPKAYKTYNTVIGYPSESDYKTVLKNIFNNNQLFHILITIEGLYIIQLSENMLKKISKKMTLNQILEQYDGYIKKISKTKQDMRFPACFNVNEKGKPPSCISGTTQEAGKQYADIVNKGGLFNIQFIPNTRNYKSMSITIFSKKCHNLKTQFNFRYI